MHNKLYTREHIADIYKRAWDSYQQYLQWKKMDLPENAFHHRSQCDALVCLMESIWCFDVGLGADKKQWQLQDRLKSFKEIK